ncbi:MAG: recombinase family protein, partial [Candidatus Limnocylindrales bacterium]
MPSQRPITAREMLDNDAAVRRAAYAAHLVALLGGHASSPPPTVVHPVLEAAPVTVGRPGGGGRKRRTARNTVTGVLNELDARYGPGKELRKHKHILRFFEIDPEGDGALMARLSGNDITSGETVAGQLEVQHEMAARHGLRPRWVIVELNADRNVTYEQRMGFALVRDLMAMRGLEWVSWRGIDRIARDQMTNMGFCRWLEKKELRLYFATDPQPLVDWKSRKLEYAMRRLVAESEADSIIDRTTDGLLRRFLESGRGWPGLIPFGFIRGPLGFLLVDEDQWAIVEWIYELYLSQLPDGRPFSMRDVLARLKAEGIDASYYLVQRVLSDRVYVTGCLQAHYKGKVYDVDPIRLERPISEEDYARAQAQRAARRGKNSVTPYGYFVLNHVPLVHAQCQETFVEGRRIRLSAQLASDRPTSWQTVRYVHRPRPKMCAVLGLPAPPLEQAVIEALYGLAGDEQLRSEWIANGRGESQAQMEDDSDVREAAIEAKLHQQRHRHADLLARFVADQAAHGDAVSQYSDLAAALAVDIRRLEQQLDRARRSRPEHPTTARSETLEQRLREELPVRPPIDDPAAMRRRVEILRACVSKVVIHDDDEDGRFTIEVFGP